MPCQVGSTSLQQQILDHWPVETYNAGCYNPNSWMDGTGPGTDRPGVPSAHQRGEAIDIGIKVPWRGRSSTGQEIFLWLHSQRERLGIVQLIYTEQIWSRTNAPQSVRVYKTNPHLDHIHVQLTPLSARNPRITAAPFPGGETAPAPDPEDDDMPNRYVTHTEDGNTQWWWFNGAKCVPVADKETYYDLGLVKSKDVAKVSKAQILEWLALG